MTPKFVSGNARGENETTTDGWEYNYVYVHTQLQYIQCNITEHVVQPTQLIKSETIKQSFLLRIQAKVFVINNHLVSLAKINT